MSATIQLPWPPSVNAYWGNRVVLPRGGRAFVQTYLTAEATQYREAVQAVVRARWPRLRALRDRLTVSIVAFPPDARVRDLDNTLKATLDAITAAGVWADDGQIDELSIKRGAKRKGGGLEVTLDRIPDPQPSLFEETRG